MSKKKKRRKKRAKSRPQAAKPEQRRSLDPGKELKEKGSERRPSLKLWLALTASVIVIGAGLVYLMIFRGRTPVKRDPRANILLITLDTTRADRLGCYGYSRAKTPNLDRLAHTGVMFENVYCQVPLTLPSHCSILTGTYPTRHNVHNNGTYVLGPDNRTLAEVLKEKGFQTVAFVASFSVDSRFGIAQGFDVYDDNFQVGLPFKPLNSERKADQVAAVFSAWLEKREAQPFFAWVHFFDPHLPYQPPSPYKEEFADDPYDGEIAYMDFCLGQVIEKVREKNLLERTLVILAGDHGEAFGEKVETGHGLFLYDGTMRVPLIFYAESQLPQGKVVRARVRLIDIMATVLDMLGLQVPDQSQGTSLVPYIEGRKSSDLESYIETFYPRENYGWSELLGLVWGDWKFIRAPRPELYNLLSDPDESQNLYPSEGQIAADLNNRLESLVKESGGLSGIAASKSRLTAEEEERLRSLGYTSFAGGAKSDYPDPKDKLDLLRLIQRAEAYEFQGKYEEALPIYEQLLSLIPDAPSSYVNLALTQARLKRFEETIQTLQKGLTKIPRSEILLARLGHTYLVTGRIQDAFDTMARVLEINSENVDALTVLAGVLDTQGKRGEARAYYERAMALEPENKYLRVSYAFNLTSSGLVDQAIEVYKKLTQDYPDDALLFQYLGIAYGITGEYSKAIESLKQAIDINPTPTAYLNLAVAYERTGETSEAIRYLKLYLENPQGESQQSVRAAKAELARLEKSIQK
jgi:arylsulfatase A-like enzyme/Flp pilus assembly protein TadD